MEPLRITVELNEDVIKEVVDKVNHMPVELAPAVFYALKCKSKGLSFNVKIDPKDDDFKQIGITFSAYLLKQIIGDLLGEKMTLKDTDKQTDKAEDKAEEKAEEKAKRPQEALGVLAPLADAVEGIYQHKLPEDASLLVIANNGDKQICAVRGSKICLMASIASAMAAKSDIEEIIKEVVDAYNVVGGKVKSTIKDKCDIN